MVHAGSELAGFGVWMVGTIWMVVGFAASREVVLFAGLFSIVFSARRAFSVLPHHTVGCIVLE